MQLSRVKIENFRLLERVEVELDELTTLIVGRNNSGKTSLVNVFEKFFGDEDCRFVLEDFSAERIADIKRALAWYAKAEAEESAQGGGGRTRTCMRRSSPCFPGSPFSSGSSMTSTKAWRRWVR